MTSLSLIAGRIVDDVQCNRGAQWLSGGVLDFRSRGCGFKPHWRHCFVSSSKIFYLQLSTGSNRNTHYDMTEKL